ncbi:MAG: glycosyltransferase family 2 protein [Candidatus Omnitrophota bacterium]
MNNSPLVSIIIVNYNGKKYLKSCFDSLFKIDYPNFEVIFVDNRSNDESVDYIKDNYKQVLIRELGSNLGLAVANNEGAKSAKGKYLFFLNNDTIVDKNILKELVNTSEPDEKIGVCACNVFTYDGAHEIGMGVSCDRFGYPCGNLGPIFYPDAAIFIKRKVFDLVGGFDSHLFLYGEDRDLCWRVLLHGYNITPVKTAWFLHDSACTLAGGKKYKTNTWKRELGERNLIRSMLKNYSFPTLVFILPQYMFLSFAELILLLFMGRFKVIKDAYFKAYIWNIANFKDTWLEHKKISKTRVVSDKLMRKLMAKQIGKIQVLKWIGVPKFESKLYKAN